MINFLNLYRKSDEDHGAEAAKLVALLEDSPAIAALRAAQDEKRVAELSELLIKWEDLQRGKLITMPELEAAVVEAKAAEKLAHDAILAASRKVSDAEHARLSASLDFSFNIGVVESEINKLAPAEIDAFIGEMRTADDKARHDLRIEQRLGPKSRMGDITETIVESNQNAVTATRDYIRNAIAEAQSMKLQALAHDEIVRRLDALKEGLPKFDRFETVKIPLPDVRELRKDSSK